MKPKGFDKARFGRRGKKARYGRECYRDLRRSTYAWWTSTTSSDLRWCMDPVAAMERFIDMASRDDLTRFRPHPMHIVTYEEWVKAKDGKPFMCGGVLCRLEGGMPVPMDSGIIPPD